MISARLDALLVTALIAFILEAFHRPLFGRPRIKPPRPPHPVLALALLFGAMTMQFIGAAEYAPLGAGSPWALPMVIVGGIILTLFTLKTDIHVPSSRRHFIGTMIAAALLFFGGLRIPFLAIPGIGLQTLGASTGFFLTLLFVFLFVSMIEICASVPVLASLTAVAVGAMVFVPAGANQTFPGQVLCGSLIGAVLGRLLATLATGRERHTDKTEVLMLGYFGAAAALATFIKSFATAGFILPLGVATVTFITLAILSFERTTILRANPRA
ncbi:hypothetical protein IT571_04210 [Candidatus Sumerlaeota bacterium]|nr:hypothetical protein [Candidatus Sumerlaeota bacterium]